MERAPEASPEVVQTFTHQDFLRLSAEEDPRVKSHLTRLFRAVVNYGLGTDGVSVEGSFPQIDRSVIENAINTLERGGQIRGVGNKSTEQLRTLLELAPAHSDQPSQPREPTLFSKQDFVSIAADQGMHPTVGSRTFTSLLHFIQRHREELDMEAIGVKEGEQAISSDLLHYLAVHAEVRRHIRNAGKHVLEVIKSATEKSTEEAAGRH